MNLEEFLPQQLKEAALRLPSGEFTWKRKDIDGVIEIALDFDIAISLIQVWAMDEGQLKGVIQMKDGDIQVFVRKFKLEIGEEWLEFVQRSTNDVKGLLNRWNMEKNVTPELFNQIYYSLKFVQDED